MKSANMKETSMKDTLLKPQESSGHSSISQSIEGFTPTYPNAVLYQTTHIRMNHMTPDEQAEWIYIAQLRGDRLFKAGLFEKATVVYIEAATAAKIVQNEELAHSALCSLVSCHLAQCNPQQALRVASLVIADNPRHLTALERRAKAYSAMQQFDSAKADLTEALSIDIDEKGKNLYIGQLEELRQIERNDKRALGLMSSDEESDDEDLIPIVSSVAKIFSLPVKLYRAFESLCRREDML